MNTALKKIKLQTEIRNVLEADAPMSTDPGTEDFLISLLQKHEEMSWMLKSHLDQEESFLKKEEE